MSRIVRVGLVLTLLIIGACTPASSPLPTESGRLAANLRLTVVAGPTCPVATTPPDPACAPRPLIGVQIALTDSAGVVTIITSGEGGLAATRLAVGRYLATPMAAEGALGVAAPFTVTIDDAATLVEETLLYDTGIR